MAGGSWREVGLGGEGRAHGGCWLWSGCGGQWWAWGVTKRSHSESDRPGLASWLCHSLSFWPWVSSLPWLKKNKGPVSLGCRGVSHEVSRFVLGRMGPINVSQHRLSL